MKTKKDLCIGLSNSQDRYFNKKKNLNVLKKSLSLGIKYYDLADNYYNGDLLKFFGKNIKTFRNKICIINKFQLHNKSNIFENLDKSLKLLNTEYLDIYMPHWPSINFDPIKLSEFAEIMIKKGKIKNFGLSNFNLDLIKKFRKHYKKKLFLQMELNINNYLSVKKIIDYAEKNNITIFSYSINNNFSKNNSKIKKEFSLVTGNSYETSLYWTKKFNNVVPIIRTNNVIHLKKNFQILQNSKNLKKKPNFYCSKNFKLISVKKINKIGSESGVVYKNINEAKKNKHNLFPSPKDISKEIAKFGLIKPLSLKKNQKGYELLSGQARFWAFQIANKRKTKVPSIITD